MSSPTTNLSPMHWQYLPGPCVLHGGTATTAVLLRTCLEAHRQKAATESISGIAPFPGVSLDHVKRMLSFEKTHQKSRTAQIARDSRSAMMSEIRHDPAGANWCH